MHISYDQVAPLVEPRSITNAGLVTNGQSLSETTVPRPIKEPQRPGESTQPKIVVHFSINTVLAIVETVVKDLEEVLSLIASDGLNIP